MTKKPIISFCIPVYNNKDATYLIVTELLKSKNERIEVVVSDNASSDATIDMLEKIKDSRLKICSLKKTIKPTLNWLNALENGKGEYLYLVMGRDIINYENIDKLVAIAEIFESKNIFCAKDTLREEEYDRKVLDCLGALQLLIWSGHPTGYIFKNECFKLICNKSFYFENLDTYPENYVVKELLIHGKAMIFNSGCNQGRLAIDKTIIKSQFEKNVLLESELFYAPKRRTKQCYQVLKMVLTDKRLELTKSEEQEFVKQKLEALQKMVSFGWRSFCSDPVWCAHYNQKVREVTKEEMCKNITNSWHQLCALCKENKEIYKMIRKYAYIPYIVKMQVMFPKAHYYYKRLCYYKKEYGLLKGTIVLIKRKMKHLE